MAQTMDLITVTTVIATVVPFILFFGWVVMTHPLQGKVNIVAILWMATLMVYEYWLIGNPKAHLGPNFLPPLISWGASVVFVIINEDRQTVGRHR